MKNDVAILVVSFDGYSDVWPTFFECKNMYWKDCSFKTYLVTNYKDYDDTCSTIKTGEETTWCDRLERALESVEEEIVILLLEDYLIGKTVNTAEVDRLIAFFIQNKTNYLRLINIPRKHGSDKKKDIYPILSNEEYGVSLQPAIWDKNYLYQILRQVGNTRSAWEFEITLLRQCTDKAVSMPGCYGTRYNILDIHNGVLKGKWFKNELVYFGSKGIRIDSSQRGVLSNKEYIDFLVRRNVRETIPPKARKLLKKILVKLNFKFVSDV